MNEYLRNNVFKQKENEQMPLLESSKKPFNKLQFYYSDKKET